MKKQYGKQGSFFKKIFSGGKKSDVNLPFSNSRGGNKQRKNLRKGYDSRKTQIGIQSDNPSRIGSNKDSKDEIETCPKCQYPLRVKPDSSSPCPNCGYTGNSIKTVIDSGKTILISSLDQETGEAQEFKFKIIKEDDKSEIEIQSPDEMEVTLNRNHLDPENITISSDQHVIMRFRNRKIYVEDVSSNGSSFIQAKNKMLIQNNTRVVLGNKIYIFNQSSVPQPSNGQNRTRKFGEFNLDMSKQEGSGFSLTDEANGKHLNFDSLYLIINRSTLDPGNNSISSSRHAEFEYNNGQWFVRDLSSNQSTFVQIKGEQFIENKIRIILGNKIFRFEYT